jgi:hypothetical protein
VAVSAVSEIVAQAQQLIEAGDGRAALAVLDVLTEEFLSVWEGLDDSDGESVGIFERLGALWAEALLTDDLSAEERRVWIPKIETWQSEVSDYGIDEGFDVALSAAVQRWEYPPLQRVLRGEIDEQGAWEGEAPFWADALAEARLNVLERQGRYHEYLYLAEAEGQTERYVTMLARLGRGGDALEYGRTHLSTVPEAHALAMMLWERGEIDRALEGAELGPIPVSLGPEDADGRCGDGRQGWGRAGRRWALEREAAHLALDGAWVVARATGRESLGADLGQHAG